MSEVRNATLVAEVFIPLFVIMDPRWAIPLLLSLTHRRRRHRLTCTAVRPVGGA
ncbi:MAG: hypothetical protein ACRDO2_02290 [Nocardioidaceae bacterium]